MFSWRVGQVQLESPVADPTGGGGLPPQRVFFACHYENSPGLFEDPAPLKEFVDPPLGATFSYRDMLCIRPVWGGGGGDGTPHAVAGPDFIY